MGYVYDKCGSYELSDFELTKKELKRFKGYHIKALTIVELDKFIKEEGFCTTIMETNNKWGLVDYAYTPVKMGINKNIFNKLDNYLYEKSKIYQAIHHFNWKIKTIPFKIKRRFRNIKW